MKEPKRIKLTDNPSHKDVKKELLDTTKHIELYDDYGYLTSIEIKPKSDDVDDQNYKTFWKTFVWDNEDNSQNDTQSI